MIVRAIFSSTRRSLIGLTVLALAVGGLFAGSVVHPDAADAAKATGGSGRFVSSIEWFSWGTNRQTLPRAGLTKTQSVTAGGQTVDITCTIGAVTGGGSTTTPLEAYRPGNWQGDGLDDLYNIGGTGNNNTLVNALSNTVGNETATFDFECSATLGGDAFPLAGLVMADAEQSNGAEYVEATIPGSAEWRIIDRYRTPGCTEQSNAIRTGQTLRLQNPTNTVCAAGPMAVAFMEGTSSATNVTLAGGAKSAIALGVAIDFDYGDAPASYGTAGHGLQRTYDGGIIPAGTTNVSAGSFALATPELPPLGLGTTVDAEGAQQSSADALGDDSAGDPDFGGPADEDSVTIATPRVQVSAGTTYTQDVICRGTPAVAGWIDFNDNGVFGSAERSSTATCAAGTATLSWTVPSTIPAVDVATFMRIRTATEAADIADPTGVAVDGEVEDHAITLRRPSVEITKTATVNQGANSRVDAGDTVTYGFSVANTGVVDLTDVQVSDPRVGGAVTCGTGTLVAGASRTCSTATYTLTQADVDAGSVSNTASVSAEPPTGDRVTDTDTVSTTLPTSGGITLALTQSLRAGTNNRADAGDVIRYGYTVTNSGNRTLTGVAVSDPDTGTTTCSPTTLAPGEQATCTTVDHTVTQGEIESGSRANTATASGQPPTGAVVTDDDSVDTTLASAPAIDLTVDENQLDATVVAPNGRADAGDTITYEYTVTNTGNRNLTGVTINSPKAGAVACTPTTLAPGASATCGPATHTLTQTEVDAGTVQDDPVASGSPASGAAVTDTAQVVNTLAAQAALVLDRTATLDPGANGRVDAGDTIRYGYTVTNGGNQTVSLVRVTDDKLGTPVTCTPATLAPGASATCGPVDYSLTQADLDAGTVVSTAQARAGTSLTSADVVVTTPLATESALVLDKQADAPADTDGDGAISVGDTIAYRFVATNRGTQTVSQLVVDDARLKTAAVCPVTVLAPGESTTCTASYAVTAADIRAGTADNTATVSGRAPGGAVITSAGDSTSTALPTKPALRLKKVADLRDADDDGRPDAGEKIRYDFTVTNTGGTDVSGITVDDPMLKDSGDAVTCRATSLAPGASTTCKATYAITAADAGSRISNTAFVRAAGFSGVGVRSAASTAVVPARAAGSGSGAGNGNGTGGSNGNGNAAANGALPDTGGPNGLLTALGLAALVGGGALVGAGRLRRRRSEA